MVPNKFISKTKIELSEETKALIAKAAEAANKSPDPLPDPDSAVAYAREFAQAGKDKLGDQIEEVWLYGSRARGDHWLYSDLDLLVVTPDLEQDDLEDNLWELIRNVNNSRLISFICCTKDQLEKWDTRLFRNIRKDGIRVL